MVREECNANIDKMAEEIQKIEQVWLFSMIQHQYNSHIEINLKLSLCDRVRCTSN